MPLKVTRPGRSRGARFRIDGAGRDNEAEISSPCGIISRKMLTPPFPPPRGLGDLEKLKVAPKSTLALSTLPSLSTNYRSSVQFSVIFVHLLSVLYM